MATDPQEQKHTYVVDSESAVELARLMKQDRLTTRYMGGIFPNGPDLSAAHDILDIACGPGGWVLDAAFEYPKAHVVGVDIGQQMVNYARANAQSQGLDNASFKVMNALEPFTFEDNAFDLVNSRFIFGFMPSIQWPLFVRECVRIARPGGIVRLTEADNPGKSNSPASERLADLLAEAIFLNKLGLSTDGKTLGMTHMLPRLLEDAECITIQRSEHSIDYSANTEAHEGFCQNLIIAFQELQPFLVKKMQLVSEEEYNKLHQQMIVEMLSDDFRAHWLLLSAWGYKPKRAQ